MVKRFKKDKKIGESAWEARILPLNYTRMKYLLSYSTSIPVFCKAPS